MDLAGTTTAGKDPQAVVSAEHLDGQALQPGGRDAEAAGTMQAVDAGGKQRLPAVEVTPQVEGDGTVATSLAGQVGARATEPQPVRRPVQPYDELVAVERDVLDPRTRGVVPARARSHVDRGGTLDDADAGGQREPSDVLRDGHRHGPLGGGLEPRRGPAVRGEVAPGDHVERAAAGLGRHVQRMLREVDPLDPDEEIDPASLGGGAGTDHPDT